MAKTKNNVMGLLLIFGLILIAKIEKFSKTPIKKYQEKFPKNFLLQQEYKYK